MTKLLFLVFGISSVCVTGVFAAHVQDDNPVAQQDGHSAAAQKLDWSKEFDASLETDPSRRMLARQYAALMPLLKKTRELFLNERLPALSLLRLEVRLLEIRYALDTESQDKRRCVELLVRHLASIEEAHRFMLEQPPHPGNPGGVQISDESIQKLVDATLKKVKWESELEQLDERLNQAAKDKSR